MTTMRVEKHEMEKARWAKYIKEKNDSGLTVKEWCSRNGIPSSKYYYWLRVVREESLIKAGTLTVSGRTQFAEVKPIKEEYRPEPRGICAVLNVNGNEIEILNGADPNTLDDIIRIIKGI